MTLRCLASVGCAVCLSVFAPLVTAPVYSVQASEPNQGESTARIDPSARAMLDKMTAAYRSLKTYQAVVTLQNGGTRDDLGDERIVPASRRVTISFRRSGDFVVTPLSVATGMPRLVRLEEVGDKEKAVRLATLRESGLAGSLVVGLLASNDPLNRPGTMLRSLEMQENQTVNGVVVDTVVAVFRTATSTPPLSDAAEETLTFNIARKDHLLRRVSRTWQGSGKSRLDVESHTAVRVDAALPETTFVSTAAPRSLLSTSVSSVPQILSRHDFGRVVLEKSRQITHQFTFRNAETQSVRIARLVPSCGCVSTVATGPGSTSTNKYPTIAPGAEAKIDVAINLDDVPSGKISKSVTLFLEGNSQPAARYALTAEIVPPITFSPQYIDFGTISVGEDRTSRAIQMTVSWDTNLIKGTQSLVSSDPAILVTPLGAPRETTSTTATREYNVTLAPDAPLGPLNARLFLKDASSTVKLVSGKVSSDTLTKKEMVTQPRFWAGVTGRVQGQMTAEPAVLAFGLVNSEKAFTRSLTIVYSDRKNHRCTISSSSPWIKAIEDKSALASSNSKRWQITTQAGAPLGVLETPLIVTLDNSQRLIVPVSAYIQKASR